MIEHCEKTQNLFLLNIIKCNYQEAQGYLINLIENLSKNLSEIKNGETEIISHSIIERVMRCLFILKGVKLNCFEK